MNLSEFKAWFEGFTEDMTKPPTAKQWVKIKARVKKIESDPTPWPVFVDRYVRPYPRYDWYFTGGIGAATLTGCNQLPVSQNITLFADGSDIWNVTEAFADLGRNEAKLVA